MIRCLLGVPVFLLCTGSVFAEDGLQMVLRSQMPNSASFYLDSAYYNERGNEWTNRWYWKGGSLDSLVNATSEDGVPVRHSYRYYTSADLISDSGREYVFSFVRTDSTVTNHTISYSDGSLDSRDSWVLHGDSLLADESVDADGATSSRIYQIRKDTLFERDSFSSGSVATEYFVSIDDGLCLRYDGSGNLLDSIKIVYQTDGVVFQYIEASYYREFHYLYPSAESAIPARRRPVRIDSPGHKYDLLGRRHF